MLGTKRNFRHRRSRGYSRRRTQRVIEDANVLSRISAGPVKHSQFLLDCTLRSCWLLVSTRVVRCDIDPRTPRPAQLQPYFKLLVSPKSFHRVQASEAWRFLKHAFKWVLGRLLMTRCDLRRLIRLLRMCHDDAKYSAPCRGKS